MIKNWLVTGDTHGRVMERLFHIENCYVPEETAIIILGDVNPGATVVSKGNVVVLGTLKGTIHAGAAGNEGAFVAALNMNPMQIRIADAIARAADDKPDKKSRKAKETSTGPMIAYTEDGNIYMEPITKEVINDIRI